MRCTLYIVKFFFYFRFPIINAKRPTKDARECRNATDVSSSTALLSSGLRQYQHIADIHDGQYSYDLAWDELKRRYEQPHVIAQTCEEKLLEFPKIERDVADRLNRLSVLIKGCCYSLANDRVASILDFVSFFTAIFQASFL